MFLYRISFLHLFLFLFSSSLFVLLGWNYLGFANTYTVINLNDSGAGSLREAITEANANPGLDSIDFDPLLAGSIVLVTDLPNITEEVEILGDTSAELFIDATAVNTCFRITGGDGSLLQGFSCSNGTNGIVVESGANNTTIGGAGDIEARVYFDQQTQSAIWLDDANQVNLVNVEIDASGSGILIENGASNITIGDASAFSDVRIGNSVTTGIFIDQATGVTLVNTWSGTLDGVNADPNGDHGIHLTEQASNILIGTANSEDFPNIFSGNIGHGIFIEGNGNRIRNSYAGVQEDGISVLANTMSGLALEGNNNLIGGESWDEHTIFSGNTESGITLNTGANNVIRFSLIGLGLDGDTRVPNEDGITIFSNGNDIGGTDQGNVISGNTTNGIEIQAGALNNNVIDNVIGLNLDGDSSAWNDVGILNHATGNQFFDNIISGNSEYGYWGSGDENNTLEANIFGRNEANDANIFNGNHAIYLSDGSNNNILGRTTENSQNILTADAGFFSIKLDTSAGNGTIIHRNHFLNTANFRISIDAPANNSITPPNITQSDTSLIAGTSLANVTLSLFIDGLWYGETNSNPDGEWFYHAAIPEGNLQALQRDIDGNSSAFSAEALIIPDIIAPNPPAITSVDGLWNDLNYTLEGTKDLYTSIVVNGDELLAVDDQDTFNIPMVLNEGLNILNVVSEDYSANVSPSAEIQLVVDSLAPADPLLTYDDETREESILLVGSDTEIDAEVWVDGAFTGELVNGLGDFAYELNLNLGANTFEIWIQDAHGNQSNPQIIEIERLASGGGGGGGPRPSPSRSRDTQKDTEETSEDIDRDEDLESTEDETISEEETAVVTEPAIEDVEKAKEEATQETKEQNNKQNASNAFQNSGTSNPSPVQTVKTPLSFPNSENLSGVSMEEESRINKEQEKKSDLERFKSDNPETWGAGFSFYQRIPGFFVESSQIPEGENVMSFIFGLNPKEKDSDQDGQDDVYEILYGLSPIMHDSDGDGLVDQKDSDPIQYNPLDFDNLSAQAQDQDEDGLEDALEDLLGLSSKNSDSDGDGWDDATELWILGTNPNQAQKNLNTKPWFSNPNLGLELKSSTLLKGFYKEANQALELHLLHANGEREILDAITTDEKGQWVILLDPQKLEHIQVGESIFLQIKVKDQDLYSGVQWFQKAEAEDFIENPQITIEEETEKGLRIRIEKNPYHSGKSIWLSFIQSTIYTQSFIADLGAQDYALRVPPNFEHGDHRIHLAKINQMNGNIEMAQKIDFQYPLRASIFTELPEEDPSSSAWILALIGFTLVLGVYTHQRYQKSHEV